MGRPLMVWDGDCSFCRLWIERWRAWTGDAVDYAPYQEVAAFHPEIPVDRFKEAVHFRDRDGRWTHGAEAVFGALAAAPGDGVWLRFYQGVPGFAAASEAFYGLVARNRDLFARLTHLLWGRSVGPACEALTTWIFLRLVGVVFAVAFLSLSVQVVGLAGTQGILPAADYLQAVGRQLGPVERVMYAPTLLWLGAGDGALRLLCGAGVGLSLSLVWGVAAGPLLVSLWVVFLSIAVGCQDFLWFQWDGLLLETAVIGALLAPWRVRSLPGGDDPPRAAVRLIRWLLFRLMFASAVVKLTSGDPSWRHLTALEYHYETQPLPTWTAWYAHQLPAWFQKLSALVVFAVEGVVPFLFIAPRRVRIFAALAIAGFQVLLIVSGNYAYFNLLA